MTFASANDSDPFASYPQLHGVLHGCTHSDDCALRCRLSVACRKVSVSISLRLACRRLVIVAAGQCYAAPGEEGYARCKFFSKASGAQELGFGSQPRSPGCWPAGHGGVIRASSSDRHWPEPGASREGPAVNRDAAYPQQHATSGPDGVAWSPDGPILRGYGGVGSRLEPRPHALATGGLVSTRQEARWCCLPDLGEASPASWRCPDRLTRSGAEVGQQLERSLPQPWSCWGLPSRTGASSAAA